MKDNGKNRLDNFKKAQAQKNWIKLWQENQPILMQSTNTSLYKSLHSVNHESTGGRVIHPRKKFHNVPCCKYFSSKFSNKHLREKDWKERKNLQYFKLLFF